jgi:hypothetical protein
MVPAKASRKFLPLIDHGGVRALGACVLILAQRASSAKVGRIGRVPYSIICQFELAGSRSKSPLA